MSKILNRIKNLLELSKSNNPNEAALALEKAKLLMSKYEISESDLIIENIKRAEIIACRGKNPHQYLGMLAQALCIIFECKYVVRGGSKKSKKRRNYFCQYEFLGFNPSQEICKYAYDVLSNKLINARKEYLKKIRGTKNSIGRADSYAEGWVLTIKEKAQNLVPKKEDLPINSTSLIALNQLDLFVANETNDKSVESRNKGNSRNAALAGFKDGRMVQINNGIDYRNHQMLNQ